MSSSDSDDDCYGNIAQKLQLMKNKYKEDKDITNTSGESATPTKGVFSAEINTDSCVNLLENDNTSLNDSGELTLDSIIANNRKKPVTRSSKNKDVIVKPLPERSLRGRRKKNNKTVASEDSNPEPPAKRSTVENLREVAEETVDMPEYLDEIDWNPRRRGRRSGRSGRARQNARLSRRGGNSANYGLLFPRSIELSGFMQYSNNSRSSNNRQRSSVSQPSESIATYSVGNTEEYPDMSDNQGLFTTKGDVIQIVDEDDTLDENEELSVKVYWQSLEFFKFTIRKYQKFTQIFDYFAQKENVSHDKLFFTYMDNMLRIDDTPDTINYSIAKFIDGGIVNQSVTQMVSKNPEINVKNGIKLKFQCQNMKKPYETVITLGDRLLSAMMKCAEHFEKPFDKLKFYFDGDLVSGKSTAKDLELEGGECIDVKIIS